MKRILSQSYLPSFVGMAKLRDPACKQVVKVYNQCSTAWSTIPVCEYLRQYKHNPPISYNNQQPPKC